MANVRLNKVYKFYDKNPIPAVADFNLEIYDKEFVVFVGPSGCGKSTTLRMIAGLEEISSGDVYIDEKRVNDIEPKDRNIAMVFQNYALYPHMSVYDNMAFGLKLHKLKMDEISDEVKQAETNRINEKRRAAGKDDSTPVRLSLRRLRKLEIDKKVMQAAEILDIVDYLDRKPKALSGGQRQRAAIGRAIVRDPKVFLMDEPLSNLDAKLRNQMRAELVILRKRLDATFVYVTHDQVEAMTLGDRIVIMRDGFIQQIGSPLEVFNHPENLFVASFIGSPQMNFLQGKLIDKGDRYVALVDGEELEIPTKKSDYLRTVKFEDGKELTEREIIVGIRPEHISISEEGKIGVKVSLSEMMGSEFYIHGKTLGGQGIVLRTPIIDLTEELKAAIRDNGKLMVKFNKAAIHFIDKETEKNLLPIEYDTVASDKKK